jgi:hypothetical protein
MLRAGGDPTTCAPPAARGKFRAVPTPTRSLFAISLAVGAIGALTGRSCSWVLISTFGIDFGVPPFAYTWISPLVLFVGAASAFAVSFGVLPGTRGRPRRAGCVAGMITYFCHAAWIATWSGGSGGRFEFAVFSAQVVMLLVVGWAPIVAGLFAGWCVERWQKLPTPDTGVRHAELSGVAALKFGLIAALVSVPLILPVHTMAKPSRVAASVFFPSAPFVVFALAAASFWACHTSLPAGALRGRIAGVLAGLVSFTGFLFWLSFAINIRHWNGLPWESPGQPFLLAFMLVGWIPLVLGGLAGGWATRRRPAPDAPV